MGTPITLTGGTEVHADMDQWAEIRRRVLTGGIGKREACRLYDIHWPTLKKILSHEEPPGYRRVAPPRRPTIEPVLPIIRQILDADATAPPKQRHTARRLWQRLEDEHGFAGGYTTVKDAVRELKVGRKEVFLPLSHPPGEPRRATGSPRRWWRGHRPRWPCS
jgi:transposase